MRWISWKTTFSCRMMQLLFSNFLVELILQHALLVSVQLTIFRRRCKTVLYGNAVGLGFCQSCWNGLAFLKLPPCCLVIPVWSRRLMIGCESYAKEGILEYSLRLHHPGLCWMLHGSTWQIDRCSRAVKVVSCIFCGRPN